MIYGPRHMSSGFSADSRLNTIRCILCQSCSLSFVSGGREATFAVLCSKGFVLSLVCAIMSLSQQMQQLVEMMAAQAGGGAAANVLPQLPAWYVERG